MLRIYGLGGDATTCHEFDTECGDDGLCARCFDAQLAQPIHFPPTARVLDDDSARSEITKALDHLTEATYLAENGTPLGDVARNSRRALMIAVDLDQFLAS
jgi:hypothetical protein